MKKIVYLVALSLVLLTSCTEEYTLEDNGFSVKELPGYVAFSVPGASTTSAPVETAEDAETETVNVEVPTSSPTDVTVNYSFGGTAVFGADFNVAGATSAGGSVVIERSTGIVVDGLPDNADIVIDLLTDDVVDGSKTILITLVSASNAEGTIAVGRAGTDLLKTAVINIADID